MASPATRSVTSTDATTSRKPPAPKQTHFGLEAPTETAALPLPLEKVIRTPRHDAITIAYTQESGSPSLLAGPWRAFEIWTQNRVYGLDAHLVCIEVFDLTTNQAQPKHPILGSRLLGGQLRCEETGTIKNVSHPLPGIGASAVFSTRVGRRVRVSETSAVTHVKIRQRVVDVGPVEEPNWDSITGHSGEF